MLHTELLYLGKCNSNAAVLDKDLNNFLSIWNKIITKEGIVQLPQGTSIEW